MLDVDMLIWCEPYKLINLSTDNEIKQSTHLSFYGEFSCGGALRGDKCDEVDACGIVVERDGVAEWLFSRAGGDEGGETYASSGVAEYYWELRVES